MQQAALCKKEDVLRLYHGRIQKGSNILGHCRWFNTWNKIQHIAEFMQHLTEEEQAYSDEKFPLRTGSNYIEGDNCVVVDSVTLEGDFSIAWIYANGRHTVTEFPALRLF